MLPLVIPHSAAGIAILGFIARDSFMGKTSSAVGLELIGTPCWIALAMAFVSIPFLINVHVRVFALVPERLEKAALNSWGERQQWYFSSIASVGLGVGLFRVGDDVSPWNDASLAPVVIIAYHPMIAPVLIFERFGTFGLKYAHASINYCINCVSFFRYLLLSDYYQAKESLMLTVDSIFKDFGGSP
jgi:molybdate/tungstate transport system permease protein